MAREISNSDDILDSRDVIERIEELEAERADLESEADDDTNAEQETARGHLEAWDADHGEELAALKALAEEAEGYSGDWAHGATLIRDSYFEDYAQQLAEDIGALENCNQWPATCIDWERAARELQMDYTSVEFDGEAYWVR